MSNHIGMLIGIVIACALGLAVWQGLTPATTTSTTSTGKHMTDAVK